MHRMGTVKCNAKLDGEGLLMKGDGTIVVAVAWEAGKEDSPIAAISVLFSPYGSWELSDGSCCHLIVCSDVHLPILTGSSPQSLWDLLVETWPFYPYRRRNQSRRGYSSRGFSTSMLPRRV